MPKKPGTNPKNEFVFFDVVYGDGSQRSNRRVPAELLGGLDKDEPALGFIIEQDRDIAEKSGRPPLPIKHPSHRCEEKIVLKTEKAPTSTPPLLAFVDGACVQSPAHPERRQANRHAGRAADEVRTGLQLEDREDARRPVSLNLLQMLWSNKKLRGKANSVWHCDDFVTT